MGIPVVMGVTAVGKQLNARTPKYIPARLPQSAQSFGAQFVKDGISLRGGGIRPGVTAVVPGPNRHGRGQRKLPELDGPLTMAHSRRQPRGFGSVEHGPEHLPEGDNPNRG